MKNNKVLLVFIEPAPYIIGFIDAVKRVWPGVVDVLFLEKELTQRWGIELPTTYKQLPASPWQARKMVWDILSRRDYAIIHVAGWSHWVCRTFIMLGRVLGILVTVESDTQLCRNIPVWKRIIKRLTYPILFKFPAHFFPGGSRQAQYFRHYGVTDDRITIAQMTVDVSTIQKQVATISDGRRTALRQEKGSAPNTTVFLFVGRLLDWKGIRELIAAFHKLDCQTAHLWLVGDGPLRVEVETAVQQNRRIQYWGRLSGDTLFATYYTADVVVVPSHAEPWGLVVNEAMATGRPVIASSAVGAVDDLLLDGQTGLLVKPKDVDSLRKAMQTMVDSPEKRLLMGLRMSEMASTWTIEKEAQIVVGVWQKILCNS